ncbi:MAG: glycosyltransferase [Candidatus Moranbacteria bacterium]|nr:glycosyltransferase [Candidatus Moranbacteria bacterium]
MVIYNEEALIERAILSCVDIVDELIIIHDGKCSDRSLEIARKYTNKIFERPHIGQAEKHRVFALEKAANDWVLQLDADEYLSGELQDNLEKLISGSADIFDVSWSTYHKNIHHFWYYKRILFKKSKVYFVGISHEGAKPIHKNIRIKKTNLALYHEPLYDNSTFATFQTKWKKWTKIHARQLFEDFVSIPKWNCDLSDWEPQQKMRIDHPILLGMIAGPAYHSVHTLKNFLKHREFVLLKLGFLSSMYHFHLYHNLAKLKRNGKSIYKK